MQITLTTLEAQSLNSLIDAAVKAVGLPAAEAAVHFSKMIKQAADAELANTPQGPEVV